MTRMQARDALRRGDDAGYLDLCAIADTEEARAALPPASPAWDAELARRRAAGYQAPGEPITCNFCAGDFGSGETTRAACPHTPDYMRQRQAARRAGSRPLTRLVQQDGRYEYLAAGGR